MNYLRTGPSTVSSHSGSLFYSTTLRFFYSNSDYNDSVRFACPPEVFNVCVKVVYGRTTTAAEYILIFWHKQ